MVNYQQAKIYKIVCNESNLIYIGSTCQTLANRMSRHRIAYKSYQADPSKQYCSIYEVLKYPSARILLVRNSPCNNREELSAIVGGFILNNECVNKNVPGRTPAEYYEANKDRINEQQKGYREANKDKITTRQKGYYEQNKSRVKDYQKKNKAHIREVKQEYWKKNVSKLMATERCACGGAYAVKSRARHITTKRHQAYLITTQTSDCCECGALFAGPEIDQAHYVSPEHVAYEDRVIAEIFAD